MCRRRRRSGCRRAGHGLARGGRSRRTPRAVVDKLNITLVETIAQPEMRSALIAQGAQPVGGSPEELRTFMREEGKKWAEVIRASGARAD